MMIDAKLCLHFAEVCLRAAEQEAGDPAYRVMLLELANEWLKDAETKLQASKKSTPQND